MDVFDVIKKERTAGKVIAGTTSGAKSVVALAGAFGLKGDASLYHQVDAEMARAILVGVLHRDLAYGNRLLSLSRAEDLAGQVMQRFTGPGIRFLTNGQFKHGAGPRRRRGRPSGRPTRGVLIVVHLIGERRRADATSTRAPVLSNADRRGTGPRLASRIDA